MNLVHTRVALVACLAFALVAQSGRAQVGTPLTYQGELQSGGSLTNGTFEMRFAAFNASTGGTGLGTPVVATVTVVNGKFTALLDFGTSLINTSPFLEIGVRPSGSSDPYTVLSPRQRLTATPNALFALSANSASTATSATSAATATNATNAANLGGQLPSFYQNATNLTAGTIPDARLGTSVARTNVAQTFTAANNFVSTSNAFTGSGAGLTALNASNITTGTIPDARLGTSVARTNVAQTFTAANNFASTSNAFTGSGAGLTALNASNITTGTLPDARLSINVAGRFVDQAFTGINAFNNPGNLFTGSYTGDGSNIVNLNAAAINGVIPNNRTTGTVASVPNALVLRDNFGGFSANSVTVTQISSISTVGVNSFLGSLGIGTSAPAANLHVADFGTDVAILGPTAVGSTQLMLGTSAASSGYGSIQGVRASGSAWGDVVVNPIEGNLGVGMPTPAARLHVRSTSHLAGLMDSDALVGTWFTLNNRAGPLGSQRFWSLLNTGPGNGSAGNLQFIVGTAHGVADDIPMVINRDGRVGIGTTAPVAELHVVGTTRTSVLEISGGSDIAEPYCVAGVGGVEPAPGMVVSIDPDQVGKLRVSSSAYDTSVAGIVSGANGVNVGLTLRQEGSAVADGSLPIANVGRVWCWVDADAGPVKPGDLLTTSHTPGHAMKADPAKANGAILGKAMSRLESGRGMVLVLVGLQ